MKDEKLGSGRHYYAIRKVVLKKKHKLVVSKREVSKSAQGSTAVWQIIHEWLYVCAQTKSFWPQFPCQ